MNRIELKGLLTLLGGIAVWFLLMILLVGCGVAVKAKGGTTNTVHADGDVKVTLVLKVDLSECEEFGGDAKLNCISDITSALGAIGDLSKVLVCDPANQTQCEILSKILGAVK